MNHFKLFVTEAGYQEFHTSGLVFVVVVDPRQVLIDSEKELPENVHYHLYEVP